MPDIPGDEGRQKQKGEAEDEMVRWHHQLEGQESEQTPRNSGRQRSLQHGAAKHQTWLSDWTKQQPADTGLELRFLPQQGHFCGDQDCKGEEHAEEKTLFSELYS